MAFQRGDMDVLAEAVERCLDTAWALTRRGFVTTEDGVRQYVHGIEDHDAAERVVVRMLAELLSPLSRQAIGEPTALESAALTHCRDALRQQAERSGRITSLVTEAEAAEVPAGVEDIEALIQAGGAPHAEPLPADAERQSWQDRARDRIEAEIHAADERTRTLVRMRIVEGATLEAVATQFTCGAAAVAAHELRLRRHLGRLLAKEVPDAPHGPATLDALLTETTRAARPPAVTRARIRRDTLRRTFQDEPASYGRRLAWGLGAAAIAAGLWAAMFFGVLPHPDDDPFPAPTAEVTCPGGCKSGAATSISVRAPQDAARVALWLATEPPQPLLVGPGGGPIRLPLGAQGHLVPLPYPTAWPDGVPGSTPIIALFSEAPLSGDLTARIAAGEVSEPGVSTMVVAQP